MRAVMSKVIGLMILLSATGAFADTKLPKCVIYIFGHCQGSLKYPNGDIYTGEFNSGRPNGDGKMIYANGDLYVGSFFQGQMHGIGDYTWADSNRYIGQFIAGNLEGRGSYYLLSKNKINPDKYIGYFKRNAFDGDGIYTYGNGVVVYGKFKDGRRIENSAVIAVSEIQNTPDSNEGFNASIKPKEKDSTGLPMSSKINNPKIEAKSKYFISGSLNSNSSTLFGRHYDSSNNLTLIELKQKDKPTDVPYSIMVGYKFDENYGVEFGYLNLGNVKSDIGASFFKSESWLLGAYFETSLYSGIAVDPNLVREPSAN